MSKQEIWELFYGADMLYAAEIFWLFWLLR